MDYEKKYKEAFERAKKFYEQGTITESLGYVFPELKESGNGEDKRISKEITKFLKQNNGWNREWLTWLKKQGEQKDFASQEVIPRYSIGDVLCDKLCTTLNKDAQPNFEIVDIRNGLYICDKGSFPISQQDEYELVAKKIEQKPFDYENTNIQQKDFAPKVEPKFHEGEWITIKEGNKVAFLKACIRNKDWNERHIDKALSIIDELVNKVKSIRPQNIWKPSDKQMKALHDLNLIAALSYVGQKQALIELYNDLKKLKM